MHTPLNILIVMALPIENVGNQLDGFGEIIYQFRRKTLPFRAEM